MMFLSQDPADFIILASLQGSGGIFWWILRMESPIFK